MKNSLLRRITKKIADWLTPLGPDYSQGKWKIKNVLLKTELKYLKMELKLIVDFNALTVMRKI